MMERNSHRLMVLSRSPIGDREGGVLGYLVHSSSSDHMIIILSMFQSVAVLAQVHLCACKKQLHNRRLVSYMVARSVGINPSYPPTRVNNDDVAGTNPGHDAEAGGASHEDGRCI